MSAHTELSAFQPVNVVMVQTGFLDYRRSKVEYIRAGDGGPLVIALHGFGDNAWLYESLAAVWAKDMIFYALSTPYHGATDWQEGLFDRRHIVEIIELILHREGRSRFVLMGYSMGGKMSMRLSESLLPRMDGLVLLAADGLKTHPLYDVSVLPGYFVRLVKGLMLIPPLFFGIARLAHGTGLISKFLYQFTQNHFATPAQRRRFFRVYASIRDFDMTPDRLDRLKGLWQACHLPVMGVFGQRDEVIPPVAGQILAAGLPDCDIILVSKGHLLIDTDLAPIVGTWLMGRFAPSAMGGH